MIYHIYINRTLYLTTSSPTKAVTFAKRHRRQGSNVRVERMSWLPQLRVSAAQPVV